MDFIRRNVKIVVLLACFAASLSPIFIRLAEGIPPMAVGFYRLTFGLPFFIATSLIYHREEIRKISKRQLRGPAMAGVFLFLHFLTFFIGVGKTTVASAVVLTCLHPVVILVITAVFFKEKTNMKIVAGVVIALLGGAVVGGGDYAIAGEAFIGDIMCFMSAVFMALYLLAGQKLASGLHITVYITIVFSCCWACFGLGMIMSGTSFTGYEPKSYFWVLVLAIVCQIGAHGLFNWSLRYISPLYLATSETVEVVYSALVAYLLFNEVPVLMQYIGSTMIIAGILIYNYFEAEAAKSATIEKNS
ncbi:MAG: DMT family transporter [Anaerovoracaceae bacterium]|jgi:drug/metabolite transporter (DMT)-like permease